MSERSTQHRSRGRRSAALLAAAAVLAAGMATSVPPAAGVAPWFCQVDPGRFFRDAFVWMVENDIEARRSPFCVPSESLVTRGEAAASLFSLDGSPEGSPHHGFSDVTAEHFDAPISWMKASGISGGTTETTFSPDRPATRGEVAVMMHRFATTPPAEAAVFEDVTEAWMAAAVGWLTEEDLLAATSPTTFSPEDPITWAEYGTLLYTYSGSPPVDGLPRGVAHTIVGDQAIGDPWIVPTDAGSYILYATNDFAVNVPVFTADNLTDWTKVVDALPVLPGWVEFGKTWAPEVLEHQGTWYLFFTARHRARQNQCIGRAVAEGPFGPFVAEDDVYMCQHERGGSIDARVFTDVDGRMYFYWKSDDNHLRNGSETVMWAQELDADLDLIGPIGRLMGSDDADHLGTVIESPQMIEYEGRYELTFSGGNGFHKPQQFIGSARCDGPLGPCVAYDEPLIASNADGAGPGEHSLFYDHDGTLQLAYGPYHQNYLNRDRVLALAEVAIDIDDADGPDDDDRLLSIVVPDDAKGPDWVRAPKKVQAKRLAKAG